jgi:phospholipid-binding lipoprotein MlaA
MNPDTFARRRWIALARRVLLLTLWPTLACAQSPAPISPEDFADEPALRTNDPWIGFNRAMFRFNDALYTHALAPVAHGYEWVVPRPVRRGLANAFANVRFPVRFVSSVLQGKVKRAGQETEIFVVNTVVGVGGLWRVSDRIPALAEVPPESFTQTLGVWHIPAGPYLVLPLLGPSGARDAFGRVGDVLLDPITWIKSDYQIPLEATGFVSDLPDGLRTYETLKGDAIDPYVALRDAYIARQEANIKR